MIEEVVEVTMIEEVVKSILEAEDKAEKMVEQARVQAGQTAADAEAECDRIRKEGSAKVKARVAEEYRLAAQAAEKAARQEEEKLAAEVDRQCGEYAKNVDAAVKIVLESL